MGSTLHHSPFTFCFPLSCDASYFVEQMNNTDTTKWMKDRFGRVPLLTPAQEIELAHAVQQWLALGDSYEKTADTARIERRGRRAKDRLIESNLRLAFSYVCEKHRHVSGEDLHDMFQEATIGLARAAEKFDPTKGYKFSTYAFWWIRQAVNRWLDTKSRTIALPCGSFGIAMRIKDAKRELKEFGIQPTVQSIATHLDITESKVESILAAPVVTYSTDQLVSGTNELTILETLSTPCEDVDEQLTYSTYRLSLIAENIDEILGMLNPAEARILKDYYGIGVAPQQQAQIAKAYNISASVVRQRLASAQKRFRGAALRFTLPT
jgi:RNA polymerase primary sigma factor